MEVSVVYAGDLTQTWLPINVQEECTVQNAIEQSGLLEQFPEIDLKTMKVGIFGKFTKLENALQPGDRIEIYRPIIRNLDDDEDDDD